MITFLYRWRIKTGKEKQFEDSWATLTKAIREQCGSYGSRLHRGDNGEYIGYAQWPNTMTRDACMLDAYSSDVRVLMREAVEYSYPDEQLAVKYDLLVFPGVT
jgi:hypothetical protein